MTGVQTCALPIYPPCVCGAGLSEALKHLKGEKVPAGKELGDLMEPRMGKSGVNHRMRKLVQLAEELGFVFEEGVSF